MADDTCEEVLRYFFTDSLNYSSQQVLHLGITLLNMFVQANFTGPEIPTDFPEFNSIYPSNGSHLFILLSILHS